MTGVCKQFGDFETRITESVNWKKECVFKKLRRKSTVPRFEREICMNFALNVKYNTMRNLEKRS